MKRNREGIVFLTAMGSKNLTLEVIGREQVAPGFPRASADSSCFRVRTWMKAADTVRPT
ncbi:hypothetical protein KRR55_04315 [Paeniglutamicibacter sp. ABSL32-1]|uniref:hypothetical protein n=1 Tax=Paeniglutamicibacter quisquiliarum TaxID=2849498 RepID=UPI001C2DD238|nr:hypothetical protein [Paeniglutamicibacter quisquiliarum]MBV1778338.1 hypothetical protein [Paeniglutamicibacter quisquiliarum]